MSRYSDYPERAVPQFTLESPAKKLKDVLPLNQDDHDRLVEYINVRLKLAKADRGVRLTRYASIDRAISTWQTLSQEDSERVMLEENSGRLQGLPVNLPVLATHLDETVAFFAEIFAPESQDFYVIPEKLQQVDAVKELARVMNQDTHFSGYHGQVSRTLRSLIKYNMGGLRVTWRAPDNMSKGGNEYQSIDMYNVSWDPAVYDLNQLSKKAEWIAEHGFVSRRDLMQSIDDEGYFEGRVQQVLADSSAYNVPAADCYYIRSPNHAGLSIDGKDAKTSSGTFDSVNWTTYGLDGGVGVNGSGVPAGTFEQTVMYLWLDPNDFGLAKRANHTYELWRFVLIGGTTIVHAAQVVPTELQERDERIPLFFSFYTDDDLGEAQRSPMELMRGLQRFSSFLMNIWILSARKSVFGVTYYDPDILDPSKLSEGQVAGYVEVKRTGRDIRTGMYKDDKTTGFQDTIAMLTQTLELTKTFFPNQALPAQIAGIQRAVKNQVSAVINSAQARLRLQARLLDTNLFAQTRIQAFRNYSRTTGKSMVKLDGITEEQIATILGSGLKALNAERVEMLLKELVTLIGGNAEIMAGFDLAGMLNMLSTTMNLGVNLGDFVRQQPQQPASGIPTSQPNAAIAGAQPGIEPPAI